MRAESLTTAVVPQGRYASATRRPNARIRAPLRTCRAAAAPADLSISRRGILSSLIALAALLTAPRPAPAKDNPIGIDPTAPKEVDGKIEMIPRDAAQQLSRTQKQVYDNNLRVQAGNNAPQGFPTFVREGYDMTIIADGYSRTETGLFVQDFESGAGPRPQSGQQVTFNYIAFNESGRVIDSSYRQGQPGQTRLGNGVLIPGFEEGLATMNVGGRRRIIVPPSLGPPVGPSTFFSAKQFEVFDIELLDVKTCERVQSGMFSKVVCQ